MARGKNELNPSSTNPVRNNASANQLVVAEGDVGAEESSESASLSPPSYAITSGDDPGVNDSGSPGMSQAELFNHLSSTVQQIIVQLSGEAIGILKAMHPDKQLQFTRLPEEMQCALLIRLGTVTRDRVEEVEDEGAMIAYSGDQPQEEKPQFQFDVLKEIFRSPGSIDLSDLMNMKIPRQAEKPSPMLLLTFQKDADPRNKIPLTAEEKQQNAQYQQGIRLQKEEHEGRRDVSGVGKIDISAQLSKKLGKNIKLKKTFGNLVHSTKNKEERFSEAKSGFIRQGEIRNERKAESDNIGAEILNLQGMNSDEIQFDTYPKQALAILVSENYKLSTQSFRNSAKLAKTTMRLQAKIAVIRGRIMTNLEFIASLPEPYTIDYMLHHRGVVDGSNEGSVRDSSAIMNSGMRSTLSNLFSIISSPVRDEAVVQAKIDSLLKDIDKKVPLDEDALKGEMTGSLKDKTSVMTALAEKAKSKNNKRRLVAEISDARSLKTILNAFDDADYLLNVKDKTGTWEKTQLLVSRCNNKKDYKFLEAIANGDSSVVTKWLTNDSHYKLSQLKTHFGKGKIYKFENCTEPTYSPPGTTKEHIVGNAVNKKPVEGLNIGEFSGGGIWGNSPGSKDMLLPKVNGGSTVVYREYDIHRYTGSNRGSERMVVGSDHSYYYTNDHYRSYKKFA